MNKTIENIVSCGFWALMHFKCIKCLAGRTLLSVVSVYRESMKNMCMQKGNMWKLYHFFNMRRTSVHDDQCLECPSLVNEKLKGQIDEHLKQNCHLTLAKFKWTIFCSVAIVVAWNYDWPPKIVQFVLNEFTNAVRWLEKNILDIPWQSRKQAAVFTFLLKMAIKYWII